MALTFTDRKWHDETTGTVTFPAWSGATRVTCRVTDEALQAVFGAGHRDNELVETFERCRASIETAALKKFETSGTAPLKLVLVTSDFDTRAPAKAEPEPKSPAEIAAMMKRYRANAAAASPSLLHNPVVEAAIAAVQQAAGDAAAEETAPEPEQAAAQDPAAAP
jgi:hypothetical protein